MPEKTTEPTPMDQVLAMLQNLNAKQTALEALAAEPVQRGYRLPGQTTGDFFKNPTPTQNRALLEFAGGVLGRDRRAPGIKGVNEGFRRGLDLAEEMRTRDKQQQMGAAALGVKGQQSLLDNTLGIIKTMTDARSQGGGPYAGTGIEAQHLNNYMAYKSGQLPKDDPRVAMAIDYLSRPKPVVTPQGTYMTPGYNIGGGSPGGVPSGFVDKPLTEGERKAEYVNSNLSSLNTMAEKVLRDESGALRFKPGFWDKLGESAPKALRGYLQSPEYKQYKSTADEWATLMVFLRSGATARQEEKDAAFENFWPQPGDDDNTINHKRKMREQAMVNATKLARQEGRVDSAGELVDSQLTPQEQAELEQLRRELRGGTQ